MSPPLILLVEDDPDAREIFSTFLRHMGFDVHNTPNGEQVLQLARELRPSVVLMDLSMPRVDGWTALGHLRGDPDTAAIPILALTAHSMDDDRRRATDAGFDGYLLKPLEPRAVLKEVRRLTEIAEG